MWDGGSGVTAIGKRSWAAEGSWALPHHSAENRVEAVLMGRGAWFPGQESRLWWELGNWLDRALRLASKDMNLNLGSATSWHWNQAKPRWPLSPHGWLRTRWSWGGTSRGSRSHLQGFSRFFVLPVQPVWWVWRPEAEVRRSSTQCGPGYATLDRPLSFWVLVLASGKWELEPSYLVRVMITFGL